MRNLLNVFAIVFLSASIVSSGAVFANIYVQKRLPKSASPVVLSEHTSSFDSSSSIPVASNYISPVSETSSSLVQNTQIVEDKHSWLEDVFSWEEVSKKITTIPESYFKEDAQFSKKLNVSDDAEISNDLAIGGSLRTDEDVTFEKNLTVDGEKIEINGVKYYWPESQSAGNLTNDGNGVLTWEEAAAGGVTSVLNNDGTLTIDPTTGDVIASLNLGNANTWTGAQTFNANTYFPNSSIFNTSGRLGIGTTAPSYPLDVKGISRDWGLITEHMNLSSLSSSTLKGNFGFGGYTSFSGGIGTGFNSSGNVASAQRITKDGDLVNIGTIQAGETHITKGGTFASKVSYATGTTPRSVAVGDLDGDGKADIVAASSVSSVLSVFINNGDGTMAAKVDYSTGSIPQTVAIGDLNGDGKADLVSANAAANTISVLFNNGDGTFASKVDYSAGSGAYAVAIGDLNGDGKPDLAVNNPSSDTVSIFINNGNGVFATKVDYATGDGPRSVAIGDIDGDGYNDLAVPDYNDDNASILFNNGDGTFGSKVSYSSENTTNGIVVGDLNGDSKPDLATVSYLAGRLSVYINNGDGTMAAKVNYTTASAPNNLVLGDVNGDGKADLVVANLTNTVSVFMNNGDGTFASKVDYSAGSFTFYVAMGDLNGDGKADLVTADYSANTMSVLMNQPSTLLYAKASTGRVGIGTTAPESKFTLAGNASIGSGYTGIGISAPQNGLLVQGNVGIGMTNPGSKLAIDGLSTGSGTALVIDANGNVYKDSSSERYKMDIEPLEVDYNKILELQPKSYAFKDSGILTIGYIAEQVEEIGGLSDLLIYDNQGRVDGFKYDRLPIYTLEVVKDLNDRVAALEDRLAALDGQVLGAESDSSDSESSSNQSDDSDYYGIIVVDEDGDVDIENNLRVKGLLRAAKLNIDTSSEAIGKVTIPAGETSALVGSATLTLDSLIYVTVDEPVIISAKKTDYDQFEVRLAEPQEFDVNVNWLVIN